MAVRRLAREAALGRFKEDTDGFVRELQKLAKAMSGRKGQTLEDD